MRRSLFGIGFLAASALPLACAPAQPPEAPRQAAPVAAVAPPPAAVAVAPPVDLSPVAEPGELLGFVRLRSPSATLDAASRSARVSSDMLHAATTMGVEEILKETMRGMVDAHRLAPLVALDAPIDAVAALDPNPKKREPIGALSVGLRSLEEAKQAAEAAGPLTEMGPGMWKLHERSRTSATCIIAASAGATPARLVCGPHDKDVTALAPYLVRTLPMLPAIASDLHAEIRFSPVEARYGGLLRQTLSQAPLLAQSQISLGEPKFDRALVEAATALGDEISDLATDLDKITFDLASTRGGGVEASGELFLKSRRSWFAQTVTERPERAGPPPPMFWRLPKESQAAFFGSAVDPARYAPMLRTVRTLLDGALTKFEIGTAADRKALVDLLSIQLGKDTSTVQASGHAPAPASQRQLTPQQRADLLVEGYMGWGIVGIDEGPAAMTKLLKDVVAVYNRRSLLAPLRKEMGDDAKLLPTMKTVPAPASLGRGAIDVEIKMAGFPASKLPSADSDAKPADAKATVSFTVHILLMADGDTTWVGYGLRRDEVVKRLLAAKSGAPAAETLASRAGLEALRTGKNLSGGFMTLDSVTSAVPRMLEEARADKDLQAVLRAASRLPNGGLTPMLFTSTASIGQPSRADMRFTMPPGAVEDIASFVVDVARGM